MNLINDSFSSLFPECRQSEDNTWLFEGFGLFHKIDIYFPAKSAVVLSFAKNHYFETNG